MSLHCSWSAHAASAARAAKVLLFRETGAKIATFSPLFPVGVPKGLSRRPRYTSG